MESDRFVPFVLYTERISKNIKRLADSKMEPYGLRCAHIMCILQLAKSEIGLSSAELSRVCGVDKAFISRITTELTEGGYIHKDPKSQGIVYKRKFILTEKGEETYKALLSALSRINENASKLVSYEKLVIFDEVLKAFDSNVMEYLKTN